MIHSVCLFWMVPSKILITSFFSLSKHTPYNKYKLYIKNEYGNSCQKISVINSSIIVYFCYDSYILFNNVLFFFYNM